MLIRKAALLGVFIFHAAPALAEPPKFEPPMFEGRKPAPKPITAFEVRQQPVEVMAVTRRARADTHFHRAYMDDSQSMGKVLPGYPQPALFSVDVRFQF